MEYGVYRFLLGDSENIQLPISQIHHNAPSCKKSCHPATCFDSHRTGPAHH